MAAHLRVLQKTPPGWNHQQQTATLAHWELKERYVVGKRGRFVKFCANWNDMLSKTRLFGTGRPKSTTGIYAPSNAASEIVSPVGRLVVSNLELFSWIQRKTPSYLKGISPLPTHFLVSIFLGFLPLFFACQSLPFPGHRCAGSMEGGSERCWRWNTWRSEKKHWDSRRF